jgi:hypothetical protein
MERREKYYLGYPILNIGKVQMDRQGDMRLASPWGILC